MNRNNIKLRDYLSLFPLRISITDHCNLRCFFCSNEGLSLLQKNKLHIDIEQLKYLIKILVDKGLNNISITGGDPTIHPKIFEIINFLNQFKFKNLFFHTNGINLNEKLLKKLSINFNKVAISVHSINFNTWQKMTGGTKTQFKKLIDNLNILSKFKDKFLIELKCVPIKNYNYSEKEFKNFVDLCNKFGFKFKFLNFEPIVYRQTKLMVPLKDVKKLLIKIGCKVNDNKEKFRGQFNYLPIKKFKYKNIFGVVIEIGCGDPEVCKECYHCNEIFITPELKIKPCHMNNFQINLEDFIKQKNKQGIFRAIIDSRLFLTKSPGAGCQVWQSHPLIQ